MKYEDYLKAAKQYLELLSEEEFYEQTERFKDVDINFNNFSFDDDDVEAYCLEYIIKDIINFAYISYIQGTEVHFSDIDSVEELDRIQNEISKYGYTVFAYDEYRKTLEEDAKEVSIYDKAVGVLRTLTSEQLETFIKEYAN